jgi:protein SCO1/2
MRRLGLVAAVVALVVAALWHAFSPPQLALGPSVGLIESGQPMPEFHLLSPKGEFSNASLKGHWTFLEFGYTHCPDVCPTHLALLSDVLKQLPAGQHPRVVFISVDGQRDTLDVLDRYVPAFNPEFIGATGSDRDLKPLVRELGVYYVRNAPEGGSGNYSVDHTSSIFLMAPDGSLRAVFQEPLDAAGMARDTAAIMAR